MSSRYSIDDFIAGSNLAYRLITALARSPSSSAEYQAALLQLSDVQHAFLNMDQLYRTKALSRDTANGLSLITRSTMEIMSKHLDRMKAAQQKLGSANSAEEAWCKTGWTIWNKDDLAALKSELEKKLEAINTLLSVACSMTTVTPPKSLDKYYQKPILSGSPTKPTNSEDSAVIRLTDATGRIFHFPLSESSTWAGMESFIKEAFSQAELLQPHIDEGHYDLMSGTGDSIVKSVWEQAAEPGLFVTMHMWPMDKVKLSGPPVNEDRWAWVSSSLSEIGSAAAFAAEEAWKRLPSRQEVAATAAATAAATKGYWPGGQKPEGSESQQTTNTAESTETSAVTTPATTTVPVPVATTTTSTTVAADDNHDQAAEAVPPDTEKTNRDQGQQSVAAS